MERPLWRHYHAWVVLPFKFILYDLLLGLTNQLFSYSDGHSEFSQPVSSFFFRNSNLLNVNFNNKSVFYTYFT